MPTAGTLDLVLTANSNQLRQELGKVRQESQATALAITNLFSGDTINAAGFRILRGTVVGLISDIDEMNAGLSVSESLTRNLAASFDDLGDIALLQLGQIAQFLGDDLFAGPLAGAQGAALERIGLGQLEGAFQIISAGANAAKLAGAALSGVGFGFSAIDEVLGNLQRNAGAASEFFGGIAKNAQLAGAVLASVADLIDESIENVLNTIAEINPAFGAVRNAAKGLGIEFKLGQALLGDYINDLKRIEDTAEGASGAFGQVAEASSDMRGGLGQASNAVSNFGKKLDQQRKVAEQFESAMRDLGDAGVLFDAYSQANDVFERFFGTLGESFNAAKGAENLTNRLQVTSTSARGAAEDLEFLTETSDELGLNFNALAEGYAQFSAAAQRTNYSSEETKDIFEDVAQAASVMRLSTADTEGVFLALRQSLSGGNVQLEELNQIAERIPGTFQAAEAALREMGYTAGSVKEIISTGTVDAEKFTKAFASQLGANSESGVVAAANSAEASVNRFNNSLNQLQVAMGQTWVQVGTPALNIFSEALEIAAQNEELLSTAIDALLVASVIRGVIAVGKFTKAVFTSGSTISLFGKQISLTTKTIAIFSAQAALAYAGTLAFYYILERLQDGAKGTRTAIASLDKSIAELRLTSKDPVDLSNVIPERPVPTGFLDGAISEFNKFNAFLNRSVGLDEDFLRITTNAENAAGDRLNAIKDFAEKTKEVLKEALSITAQAEQGKGPIAELKQIDAQLKQIEQRKLGINPNDAAAIAAIRKEEETLLKQRADAQKQVQAAQAAINNALEQTKQQLQELEPGELGADKYPQAKEILDSLVAPVEQGKAKFDELTDKAVDTAKAITDNFKQSSAEVETSFSNAQAAIAEALAKGEINEEEAQDRRLAAEKKYLEDKLALNRTKIGELQSLLSQNDRAKAVTPESPLLSSEQEEQYQQQVQQLELDTAQTRIQLAQQVRDEKKKSLDQELEDFRQANEEAEAIIKKTENARITSIRQQQLAGKLSEDDANQQIQNARQQSIKDEIDSLKGRNAQIAELETQGALSAAEARKERLDLESSLSDLNLQLIENEVQAREEANRRVVADIERANQQAETAIAQSQQGRIVAVKQAQLNNVVSEKESAQQIQQIQQDSLKETIALKQREISEVQRLRQQGVLSAQEARDQEIELNNEIGALNIQQIEGEITAQQQFRQDKIDAIEEELTVSRNAAEVKAGLNQLAIDSLNQQNNLLQAQLALLQAQSELKIQPLEFALEDAENNGFSLKAEELRRQIIDEQIKAQREQFAIEQKLLESQQKQNALELENQQIQAAVAIEEANIAVLKAEIEGASQKEIDTLTKILELRKKQADAVEAQVGNQKDLNQLEADALAAQQAADKAALARQKAQEEKDPFNAAEGGSGGGGSKGLGAGAKSVQFSLNGAEEIVKFNEAKARLTTASTLASLKEAEFANGNEFIDKFLAMSGRTDVLKLAELSKIGGFKGQLQADAIALAIDQGQLNNQEAIAKIDELIKAVREDKGFRNLNISAPDPLSAIGDVLSSINKGQMEASGL